MRLEEHRARRSEYRFAVRRRLLIAAVFLLAGAVVNVAVAWGCAIWIDPPDEHSVVESGGSRKGPSHRRWGIATLRKRGAFRVYSSWHDLGAGGGGSGPGLPSEPAAPLVPKWAPFLAPTYEPPIPAYHAYFADARGWPRLSMWSGLKVSQTPSSAPPMVATLGIALDPEMIGLHNHRNVRLLPLRPLPIGFAVNTLIYAMVLWLLIPGPFVLRRFIRVKRSLCPACAYPTGESAVCSECGKALPGRVKAAT